MTKLRFLLLLVLTTFLGVNAKCFKDKFRSNINIPYTKKTPIIFHEKYDISFMGIENLHPFDSKKYGKVFNNLCKIRPATIIARNGDTNFTAEKQKISCSFFVDVFCSTLKVLQKTSTTFLTTAKPYKNVYKTRKKMQAP